ncbi:MAG TPA: lactate racemase domain-containing protein [Gemmataceae bacterium]|nr:lactate racemase domain-containing protein [Gemmataceae bacterium]
MHISMNCGRSRIDLDVADDRRPVRRHGPPPLADPAAAMRAALRAPHDFPPLSAAVTADDHVAIVVDESLPDLAQLLTPVLEELAGVGIDPANITLLCEPSASGQPWLLDLPDAFEEVRLEVHDPKDRKKLSYLASTRQGRRLYLNRTAVDADQSIVLSCLRYDSRLVRGAAVGALFPSLSDEATRAELNSRPNLDGPDAPAEQTALGEAMEAAWLLGAPFFIQVIESSEDGAARVVAGAAAAVAEGRRALDAAWRWNVPALADVVVASLSGDPARQTFADLAAAAACAAAVVQPDGRIILLTEARPDLKAEAEELLRADDAGAVFDQLRRRPPLEQIPALRWASAARRARLSLLSALEDDAVEQIFATPLNEAAQVQRLLNAGGTSLFLEDAHRGWAVVAE